MKNSSYFSEDDEGTHVETKFLQDSAFGDTLW
jgi:hypothetical protein